MNILVVGDSLSFGCELPDVPEYLGLYGNDDTHSQQQLPPSQYAWPSLIGKRLNVNVDNLSIAGGSNDRIFRLAVTESAKQSYQCVICAWTAVDRFDFSYQGQDLPLTAGVDVSLKFPWFKSYLANHYDELKSQQRWLSQLLCLQALFKQQQQPYVFIKSCHVTVDKSLQYLWDKIDTDHCIDWKNNMLTWCSDLPRGPNGHFLEQGHELVANYVIKHIHVDKAITQT